MRWGSFGSLNSSISRSRRSGRHPCGTTMKVTRLCAGGTPAWRRKHIRPYVEHRQQVVASARIGDGDDHRLLRKIEIGTGVQGVEVGTHDGLEICCRKCWRVSERVHRAAKGSLAGLDIGELLTGYLHGHERIEVDIGIDANGVRLRLGNCR